MKRMHLICNAHIDPMWQWDGAEGIGCALSTFRVAAELAERYEAFVFNHNEAVLYRWSEEYEPQLFQSIRRLVSAGRWHIMGGWYLQPDCNMPSGESFVRQIQEGNRYFAEKFGARPTTAINFDSFGHTRGLVQILQKAGYDSYLVCRPYEHQLPVKDSYFQWEGFAGSRVRVLRMPCYNTRLGEAAQAVERRIRETEREETGVILWGVGNHGGGPSRRDLEELTRLIASRKDLEIVHSTPEAYFAEKAVSCPQPNSWAGALRHTMPGCYTSMSRVKAAHRRLENTLIKAEYMAAHAWYAGLTDYPAAELASAWEQLLFAQFHDILPGSGIQEVEAAGLGILAKGQEEAENVATRAFYKLAQGQAKAGRGELPILVYHPHPFPAEADVACEFMLADQNYNDEFILPRVYAEGSETALFCQAEKERSNLPLQWRKKTVFHARLLPGMNRFNVRFETLPAKPAGTAKVADGKLTVQNAEYAAAIDFCTGLLDRYEADGVSLLGPDSARILTVRDSEDSWGMNVTRFDEVTGQLRLATPERAAEICGVRAGGLAPVRIVEDGEVRTVAEAVFEGEDTRAVVRYTLPRFGRLVEVEVRLMTFRKDTMFKLGFSSPLDAPRYRGSTAFGVEELEADGTEVVAQDWVSLETEQAALTVFNAGTYGSSFEGGEVRMSLLRTAAYCAHPIGERVILPQDRFTPRIDRGERVFRFWLHGGKREGIAARREQARSLLARPATAISFFPPESGEKPEGMFALDNPAVSVSAVKKREGGDGLLIRLWNGEEKAVTARLSAGNREIALKFLPYEVVAVALDKDGFSVSELIERGKDR